MKRLLTRIFIFLLFIPCLLSAQAIRWAKDGNSYFKIETGEINRYALPENTKAAFLSKADLTPSGQTENLKPRAFYFSDDATQVLIYTNSKKVWRLDTEGDYWVLNLANKKLTKV